MRPDDEGEAWKESNGDEMWAQFARIARRQEEAWQALFEQSQRKRPAELDDKDRKNPWGHIPYHN